MPQLHRLDGEAMRILINQDEAHVFLENSRHIVADGTGGMILTFTMDREDVKRMLANTQDDNSEIQLVFPNGIAPNAQG